MKKKNRAKELNIFFENLNLWNKKLHTLSFESLQLAKQGDIEIANFLIESLAEFLDDELIKIIEWFERFGNLRWNNKKKSFVYGNGVWKLEEAKKIPILGREPAHFLDEDQTYMTNSEAARDEINKYLFAHPIDESEIGRVGLRASKKRWGDYKIRNRRREGP